VSGNRPGPFLWGIPGSQGLKTSPTSAPDPTKSLAQQREINAQMQPRLGLLGPLATVQSEQKPKPETEKPDDGNKLRRAA
jgi:hypothetical protein